MSERYQQAVSCSFYTYVYGDDLSVSSHRFYETQAMAGEDLRAFRTELLKETGRRDPLPEMKIVRIDTVPVTPKALVDLFNDLDGKLGGFIRSREVVEVITEPQVTLRRSEPVP
jgi:hypothetical protein